ncbi:MAG: hemolysin III family protein, partial [Clostridia bacterium]|nr:hemolysin III family protein [Clostridia bacterium]
MNISIHDYQAIAAGKVRRAKREEWRHSRIEALRLPDYTFTEEVLNCATHALGAVLGAVGLLMSLRVLLHAGSTLAMTSMTIFCVTMVMLYTNSALYHGWELTPVKKMFQVLDHCTIFLLIAGTYAPYTLMVMGNAVGKMIFGGVAAACLVGIALNLMDMKKYRVISMVCYLAAGWCIIFAYRW